MSYEGVHDFYVSRIEVALTGSFSQRMEWLELISRVASTDDMLTHDEFVDILIRLNKAHIKTMEDNWNAGWNE